MARTVEAAAIISAKDMTGPAFASASRHAKGFQRNSATITRQMRAQTAAVVGYGKAMGAALGITAAAAVYKLGRTFKDTTDRLDELGERSRQIGISAGNIQILQRIAKKEGIAGDQVVDSLKNVSQNYVSLQKNLKGTRQLKLAFPALAEDIKNAKSVEEAVSIAITAMDKMNPEDALKWSKMMFGNEDFSKLKQNMGWWRNQFREAKRLGGWVTPEMTKAASDYNDAMDDFGTALDSAILPLTVEFARHFTPVVKSMTEWLTVTENKSWLKSNFLDFLDRANKTIATTRREWDALVRAWKWLEKSPQERAWENQAPQPGRGSRSHPGNRRQMLDEGLTNPGAVEHFRRNKSGVPSMGRGTDSSWGGGHIPGKQSSSNAGGTGRGQGFAATSMSPEAKSFLAGVSSVESGKHGYQAINYDRGGGAFKGTRHPFEGIKRRPSTAAGKYQFLWSTWLATANKMGIDPRDFSPANQDRAAWFLAQEDYKRKSGGRDLSEDMKDPKKFRHIAKILGTDRRQGKAQWVGLGAATDKAVNAMQRQREADLDAASGARRPQQSSSQVHQIGKGKLDINMTIAGQPVQVDRIKVQQPDLMTLNTGIDNTGARHYRPGAPLLGPI